MKDTEQYKGYVIRVEQDQCPENPLEVWDCEPPTLVLNEGRFDGYGLTETPPDLTRGEIKEHASEIARSFGASTLLRVARDYVADESNGVDAINAAIADRVADADGSDKLDMLAEVWQWKGCTVYNGARRGYVQRQYADILVVATPDWLAASGVTEPTEGHLSLTADLYADWAWGDVYGYVIEDSAGEELDSCWGYYGADHEASGLMDAARDVIDYYVEKARKARLEQVKAWVKHRVPLDKRVTA